MLIFIKSIRLFVFALETNPSKLKTASREPVKTTLTTFSKLLRRKDRCVNFSFSIGFRLILSVFFYNFPALLEQSQ